MATIRERSGKLIADFRYMGIRCRETTSLEATTQNRKLLKKRLEQLEAEITLGTFEYAKYFPKSKRVTQFTVIQQRKDVLSSSTPLFKDFAHIWFNEKKLNGAVPTRKRY